MNSIAPPSTTVSSTSPFEHNHADPWAKTFIDLPELNASVTDAIAQAITKVRTAARQNDAELRTSSLLVLGPAGAGKTHLFARLRRKLGPKAIFVHLRPLVGTEMTPRYVLGQIVHQLGYESLQSGTKQLGTLVGSSLAQLDGASPNLPRAFLDEIEGLDDTARAEKLEWALDQLLERHPEADDTYLARLLEAPFVKIMHQRAALAWLGGQELEESQMKRLGVTAGLAEDRVMQALRTLGLLAAPGAPIVLVFDQLENLMDAEASGTRVRSYANLVAELFDATRGFVLVQMALDSEWEHAILPQLSAAQTTRLAGHTEIISLPTPVYCAPRRSARRSGATAGRFGRRDGSCRDVAGTQRFILRRGRDAAGDAPPRRDPRRDAKAGRERDLSATSRRRTDALRDRGDATARLRQSARSDGGGREASSSQRRAPDDGHLRGPGRTPALHRPAPDPAKVLLSPLLAEAGEYLSRQPGRFVLGQRPTGEVLCGDLSESSTPHLLIGGTTGSGKSVLLRAIIASLVHYHGPAAIRFTLIDPKRVTFNVPSFQSAVAAHLDGRIGHDAEDAIPVIERLVDMMEERYKLFETAQVSHIQEFNDAAKPEDRLERRIVVIDEFQDLTAEKANAKPFFDGVKRLGAKARAAGVHLILATQRPDRDVVPPLLKTNLGGKIALRVATQVNSRIILDQNGAEKLMGKGDLLADLGHGLVRAQAPIVE